MDRPQKSEISISINDVIAIQLDEDPSEPTHMTHCQCQNKGLTPPPPLVSFRQHLPDAPFVIFYVDSLNMIKWRTFICYGPICMLYGFAYHE